MTATVKSAANNSVEALFGEMISSFNDNQKVQLEAWRKEATTGPDAMKPEAWKNIEMQHKIQGRQQLVEMITNFIKSLHEMAMAVVRNFRV